MKIIPNCWSLIETYSCQYGAYLFDGLSAKIYVYHWLDVDGALREEFSKRNEDGFVGHCLLVFHGVRKFDIEITTYGKQGNETIWDKPLTFNYSGTSTGATTHFYCEGSLQGFPSSVGFSIEAEKFELHILEKDEPAKES